MNIYALDLIVSHRHAKPFQFRRVFSTVVETIVFWNNCKRDWDDPDDGHKVVRDGKISRVAI